VGGAASTRFHRPHGGIGISERAQKHILSASLLSKEYNFFSSIPDSNSDLLLEREPDEAYLAYNTDNDLIVLKYILFVLSIKQKCNIFVL
jgi:hypothetical protein